MTGQHSTTPQAVGVPYDDGPAGFEASDKVYGDIEAGAHDEVLDRLERMIRQRAAFDRRRPGAKVSPPAGVAGMDLVSQVQHGWFGRHTSMLGEAVANRRRILRAEAAQAMVDRMKANVAELADGDPVRVHPEAPLNRKGQVLLGKTGRVVGRPMAAKAVVRFDDGQPLGDWTGRPVKMDRWMLEKIDPAAAGFALSKDEARLLAAVADQELRERLDADIAVADGVDLDTLDALVQRLQAYASS